MDITEEVDIIEEQIIALKEYRDELIMTADLSREQINKILVARTPKRTLCQILRELHDEADENNKVKIEQALLIAKKMDARIISFAGQHYTDSWYDKDGKFKG